MPDSKTKLAWWPFMAADAVFLGVAFLLLRQGHKPLLWWEALLMILCATAAVACFLFPFLRRNKDEQSLAQAKFLADAVNQIQRIDQLAAQMTDATNQWREFQTRAAELGDSSKTLAGSIAAEAKAFSEFLQRANEGEKAHLRLEVDKLRRAEAEWLHVVIHIFDHVFALSAAARHSGQRNFVEQINLFQNNCREAARRIGLVPTVEREGEIFDPKRHQLKDQATPGENAVVVETLAPGYSFQGRLVRRALVAVKEPAGPVLAEQAV